MSPGDKISYKIGLSTKYFVQTIGANTWDKHQNPGYHLVRNSKSQSSTFNQMRQNKHTDEMKPNFRQESIIFDQEVIVMRPIMDAS